MTATSDLDTPPSFTGTGTIKNPATGAVAGTVRWTDPADVAQVAAGLRAAQKEWEARGPKGRAKVLSRYAVWLGQHRAEIERLLIEETGKSAADAAQEVPLIIMIASYYIKNIEKALAPETRPAALPFLAIKKISVHYRPRPVVGIIAPWNYPVANALMDAIGALAAGCAVLLKPSERTPLTAELLLRGWLDSGAPEVLALVQGAREVSEAVIDSSDFVQFTGSCATGAKVMERAARTLTPVSLELGGKDPMLVLEDADIDLAAHAAVWGAMFNAGQTCVSVERVYVVESVYDQFVAAVRGRISMRAIITVLHDEVLLRQPLQHRHDRRIGKIAVRRERLMHLPHGLRLARRPQMVHDGAFQLSEPSQLGHLPSISYRQ